MSNADNGQKCFLKTKPFVNYEPRTVLIFPWTASFPNAQTGEMRRFIYWDAEFGWVISSVSLANWEYLNPRRSFVGFQVLTRTQDRKAAYELTSVVGATMTREQRAWYEAQQGPLTEILERFNGAESQEERAAIMAKVQMPEAQPWMLARENLAKSLAVEMKTASYSKYSPQWQRMTDTCQHSEVFTAWELSKYKRKTGEEEFYFLRETKDGQSSCHLYLYPLKAADLKEELKPFAGKRFKLARQVEFSRVTGKVLKVHKTFVIAVD
jgi:hypothetical protein